MGKIIDETGHRYGRLTVQYLNKGTPATWHCVCDCGNEIDVQGGWLRSGNTKSCGCLQKDRARESNIKRGGGDFTGKQIGDFYIIGLHGEEITSENKKQRIWKCQCKCGNILYLSTSKINSRTYKCCDDCIKKILSENNFTDETGKKYGKLTALSYVGRNTDNRFLWLCQCECGNLKITTSKSLHAGLCTSCGCIKSKGEAKINQILNELKINFKTQYYFQDLRDYDKTTPLPLYFDFAIFDDNNNLLSLIEYQGIQHYGEEIQDKTNFPPWYGDKELEELYKRDKLKKEYCKKNNIKLIEIKYTEYSKLNKEYLRQVMQNEDFHN